MNDTKDNTGNSPGQHGDQHEASAGPTHNGHGPTNAMVRSALTMADELEAAAKLIRTLAEEAASAQADAVRDGTSGENADRATNATLGLVMSLVVRPAVADAMDGFASRGMAIMDPDGSMLREARRERRSRHPLDF